MQIFRWLPKRPKKSGPTACVHCGFLGIDAFDLFTPDMYKRFSFVNGIELMFRLHENIELSLSDRQKIMNQQYHEKGMPHCVRGSWSSTPYGKTEIIDDAIFPLFNRERKCNLFFLYCPGYTPAQHFQLQQEHRTNMLLWRVGITGAIVGASAAIIAGILTVVVARYLD